MNQNHLALCILLTVRMAVAEELYQNQFAVEVAGGDEVAEVVAGRLGLLNLGRIGDLKGHYLFESQRLQKRYEKSNVLVQLLFSLQINRALSRHSSQAGVRPRSCLV